MSLVELASFVAPITALSLQTATTLEPLLIKFPSAHRTITSIQQECTFIGTSLSQIQSSLLQNTASLERRDVAETFYVVITGCKVLFSYLERKVEELRQPVASSRPWHRWGVRISSRKTCSDEEMEDLEQKLKGQREATHLLMGLLKMLIRPSV